jgi:hypothetical protein
MATPQQSTNTNVPLEAPEVVGQKSQTATKLLADSIGLKYQQFLNSQKSQAQTSTTQQTNLNQQSNVALKTLADSIASKFQFINEQKSTQQTITTNTTNLNPALVPIPVPVPVPNTVPIPVPGQATTYINQSSYQGQNMVGRGSHIVSERKLQPKITTNVTENVRGSYHPSSRQINNQVSVVKEEGVFHHNIVEKTFEMVIEKPVVREIIVEKPYEVIIQRPVENIIEKEIIYEKHIDNPIERIIEQSVERIVEKKVEVLVEKPVYIENFIDKPIENIIHRDIEVIVERDVPVTRNVNKTIERTVLRPIRSEVQTKEIIVDKPVYEDVVVEKPIQKIVEKFVDVPFDVFVDREFVREVERPVRRDVVVEKHVQVPFNKYVDVPEIKRVKKSHIIQRVVDKPIEVIRTVDVPVRKTVERIVDKHIYVDRVVERPVDRIVERPTYVDRRVEVPYNVEVEKEVIVDRFVDIEVEQIVEVPVYTERRVDVEVEKKVAKYVEVLNERFKDVEVFNEVVIPVEKIIEKRVRREKRVPRIVEVEKIVEVPTEKYIDKQITIDKIIEKPVYVEKIVDKPIHRVVERRVEVPVDKYVEVPHQVFREKYFDMDTIVDKAVYVDRYVEEKVEVVDDSRNQILLEQLQRFNLQLESLRKEQSEWSVKVTQVKGMIKTTDVHTSVVESKIGFEENVQLRNYLNQLHEEFNRLQDEHSTMVTSSFRQEARKSGLGSTRVVSGINVYLERKSLNLPSTITTSKVVNYGNGFGINESNVITSSLNQSKYVLQQNGTTTPKISTANVYTTGPVVTGTQTRTHTSGSINAYPRTSYSQYGLPVIREGELGESHINEVNSSQTTTRYVQDGRTLINGAITGQNTQVSYHNLISGEHNKNSQYGASNYAEQYSKTVTQNGKVISHESYENNGVPAISSTIGGVEHVYQDGRWVNTN